MITEIVLWPLPQGMSGDDVAAKYRASVPTWQGNPDLIHKAFFFDQESRRGGGVYLWKTIEAAKQAHGPAFQERMRSIFGAEPQILRDTRRNRQCRQTADRGSVMGIRRANSWSAAGLQALKRFRLASIAAGHCTGWRAMAALYIEFGDRVVTPLVVGKQFRFSQACCTAESPRPQAAGGRMSAIRRRRDAWLGAQRGRASMTKIAPARLLLVRLLASLQMQV